MRKYIVMAVLLIALFAVSCAQHIHTVGKGPQTGQVEEARQWWILFGLVPLNKVDTDAMAGGATDYEITTVAGPIDILIGIPAAYVTVSSRTVTVTK